MGRAFPEGTNRQSYSHTRDALEYLYEQAIRDQSFDMAEILLQALACCEQLLDEKYRPAVQSQDAINCLNFIKAFMALDDDKKQRLAHALSDLH